MSKVRKLIVATAMAALALPAFAGAGGSWPPTPAKASRGTIKIAAGPAAIQQSPTASGGFEYIGGEAGWQLVQPGTPNWKAPAVTVAKAKPAASKDGFEYAAGESGWQLAQHKYEFVNRKLVMSAECDHALRAAKALTPEDLRARDPSPGA